MNQEAKASESEESIFPLYEFDGIEVEERIYVAARPPIPPTTPEERKADFISTSKWVSLLVIVSTVIYFLIPQPQDNAYTGETLKYYKEKNDGDPRFLYIPNQDYVTIVDEIKEGRRMSDLFDKSYRGYGGYDEKIVALEESYYNDSRAIDNSKLVQIDSKEKYYDYRLPSTMSCDVFNSENAAYEAVSKLAFEGVTARIVKSKETYRLELGPYASKQEAHQVFKDLKSKNILNSCRLIIF